MTETQATTGSAGAPATPAEEQPPVDAAGSADTGGSATGTAENAGSPAAESTAPKYTRPPGMQPPPDSPVGPGGVPAGSLSTPAPTPGAGAADAPSDAGAAPAVEQAAPTSPTAPASGRASVSGTGSGSAGVVRPPGVGEPSRVPESTVRTGAASVPVSGVPAAGALSTPSGAQTVVAKAQVPAALTTPSGAHQNLGATVATAPPVIARATVGVTAAGAGTLTRPAPAGTAAVGAARVSEAVRTARATVAGAASRGPRRARLHLKRIDPWSMMKFAFAVSLVLFVVVIVATSVLYLALDAMGVFDSINKALTEMLGQANGGKATGFKITAKGVIGSSVLLGAVNMVLFTALMTLAAFVYNVCADLVGGVELTLSEKD